MSKKARKLTEAILETAEDLRKDGVLSEENYAKITMRHLNKEKIPEIDLISGEDIKAIREREHLSQAVFAHYLNLTVSYISQLERGVKQPTGAVLVLLDIARRKGINVMRY